MMTELLCKSICWKRRESVSKPRTSGITTSFTIYWSVRRPRKNKPYIYYLPSPIATSIRCVIRKPTILFLRIVNRFLGKKELITNNCLQSDYHNLDEGDECYELSRLKQSMEMVGFCSETQRRVFAVLSAVLHIGNVEFQPKKSTYHHDESVTVKNTAVVTTIAQLLRVKEEILHQALISKRARASGETLVINYRMPEVKTVACH